MATLAQIRAGVAANLNAAFGANVQTSAYVLSQPTPPAMQVVVGECSYDRAMHRGLDMYELFVETFVANTTDIGAQVNLENYMQPTGASSVKTAVESDKTLGGVVDTLHVTGFSPPLVYTSESGEL